MRRGGEITGFEQVTKPYLLRYAGAKAFNSSGEYPSDPGRPEANPVHRRGYGRFAKRYATAGKYPHLHPTLRGGCRRDVQGIVKHRWCDSLVR
jgi:Protein of unknown function (DUF3435)